MTAQWPYSVSITSSSGETRSFVADTSFEPYRREAFRHRSIPSQRQSIQMTNIAGEGTVSTEGLWRREQVEWSMGAGQYSLDRRGDNQENRYFSSKGVDVFSYPFQAKLLPATYRKDALSSVANNLQLVRCGDYVIVANGTTVTRFDTSWNAVNFAGSFGTVNSITTNDAIVYIATTNGVWYADPTASTPTFSLYAANDTTTGYTGGYSLIRWCNDQLIAACKNRLYAFQPRTSSSAPYFGAVPSTGTVNAQIVNIAINSTSDFYNVLVTTSTPHGLSVGQPVSINTSNLTIPLQGFSYSSSTNSITITTDYHQPTVGGVYQPIVQVGDNIQVTLNIWNGAATATTPFSETVTVASVGSSGAYQTITYQTTQGSAIALAGAGSYFASGSITDANINVDYNGQYTVASVPTSTTFTYESVISMQGSIGAVVATGGSVLNPLPPDVLTTHQNPNWVWSDATGGETEVYFSGYVNSPVTGPGSGLIYRSDYNGSTTTNATNVGTVSSSGNVQPFYLNTPIQALPMSPDEYPTCIKAYLNFIFIGTNRGIRMTQTLGAYAPTTTTTSDLKSGPLIPNILQPVSYPVTAIVGDGRFVWFSWNNYDSSSTGLGRLDLSTFINGDPLTPAYASDLMVSYSGSYSFSTGQGMVNSLDWDPLTNTPLMAIGGLGVYGPKATNYSGIPSVTQYVPSGTISSGYYDYGIPDKKVMFGFAYNAVNPTGCSVSATVISDPDMPSPKSANITAFTGNGSYETSNQILNTDGSAVIAVEFQTIVTLTANSGATATPILHRWTAKAWPRIVQGTQISAVIQLFSVNEVDGAENYFNSYENFIWLENLRQSQDLVTYTEGPLSAVAAIDSLDWIPHKRRDNYENGFEGDCVVFFKTLAPYIYTAPATS